MPSSPKPIGRPRSASSSKARDASYDPYIERKKAYIEKMKQREKMLYNDAVECPICFLVNVKKQHISFSLTDLFCHSIILLILTILVAVINRYVQNALSKFIVL
jgi:hypothetical protein